MTPSSRIKLDLRWRKLSIRVKLLLPVIAANILAFVILITRVPPPINALVESNAQSSFTAILTDLRTPILQFLQDGQRDLATLSDSEDLALLLAAESGGSKADIISAQAGVTSLFASKITEGQLPYMDIRYLDTSGKQLARATARQIGGAVSGVLVSNADLTSEDVAAYFKNSSAPSEGTVSVLPVRMSAPLSNSGLSPEPLLELAAPVYYDSKLSGYLIGSLRAHDFLTQAFQRSGAPNNTQAVLSDQQGHIIAASNPSAANGISLLGDEAVTHLDFPGLQLDGKTQGLRTIGERIYLSVPLSESGAPLRNDWLLSVSNDLNSVYAGARDLESILVITLSIVFIFALGGIGLISQSVISPLVEVGHTANRIANGDLEAKASVNSEDEVGLVALALNTMSSRLSDLIRTLEVRVHERTRNIEVAAEISRDTTQLTSLHDLLQRTVNAVSDRFGLYHVQIFLADEKNEYAVLVVGTGDAATQMLAAHHRLEIGSASIVGQAMQSGHPTATLDTKQDAQSHRYNPYLPLTRSEMAVPMRIGDLTIGVLDVQSTETNAFNSEDENIFQMIANQLAIAINNVRLFERSQEARRMADDANRQKSEFLSNMSHELRTPLNVIIGYSHSMLTRPAMYDNVALPSAYAAAIESIRTSGQHLFGLISDILDLSKIEAGKIDLDIRPIDILPVLEGVRSTALGLVKNDVQIQADYPTTLPLVSGDETRIRQILLNLLSNAAKFTTQGFITINAVARENMLQFSVADTGKGIPDEVQPHIFERFEQGSAMIGKQFGGTGLGLNISKQLVKMHGGEIWFKSEKGQGSIFYFTIPLASIDAASLPAMSANVSVEAAAGKSRAQIFGQTETEQPDLMHQALIVDTNSATRAALENGLSQAGYSVLSTDNHERAINVAAGLAPEVVVIHLHANDVDQIKALPDLLREEESLALSSIITISPNQTQDSSTDLCALVLEQIRTAADA